MANKVNNSNPTNGIPDSVIDQRPDPTRRDCRAKQNPNALERLYAKLVPLGIWCIERGGKFYKADTRKGAFVETNGMEYARYCRLRDQNRQADHLGDRKEYESDFIQQLGKGAGL